MPDPLLKLAPSAAHFLTAERQSALFDVTRLAFHDVDVKATGDFQCDASCLIIASTWLLSASRAIRELARRRRRCGTSPGRRASVPKIDNIRGRPDPSTNPS